MKKTVKSKWIKIEKQLPEDGVKVLLLIEADTIHCKGYMEIGYFDKSLNLYCVTWNGEKIQTIPVAWMQLPNTKL